MFNFRMMHLWHVIKNYQKNFYLKQIFDAAHAKNCRGFHVDIFISFIISGTAQLLCAGAGITVYLTATAQWDNTLIKNNATRTKSSLNAFCSAMIEGVSKITLDFYRTLQPFSILLPPGYAIMYLCRYIDGHHTNIIKARVCVFVTSSCQKKRTNPA